MSINGVFNATTEMADTANYPNIRLATVMQTVADAPQTDVLSVTNYSWARASPAAMYPLVEEGSDKMYYMNWFSAACFFSGRNLHDALNGDVPIGLVAVVYRAQRLECFSSAAALADGSAQGTCGGTRVPLLSSSGQLEAPAYDDDDEYECKLEAPSLVGNGPIWDGMLHPILPLRLSGLMWYQGECECTTEVALAHVHCSIHSFAPSHSPACAANSPDAARYSCLFPAFITDLRARFGQPNLTFVYVQIAAYAPDLTKAYESLRVDYAPIRAAQDAALLLPRVGVAVAIDLGDPTSPIGTQHSRRKQEVWAGGSRSTCMHTCKHTCTHAYAHAHMRVSYRWAGGLRSLRAQSIMASRVWRGIWRGVAKGGVAWLSVGHCLSASA